MIRTTTTEQGKSPVETVVPIAILSPTQASRLPLHRRGAAGFTLAELLVTLGVLVVLVLLFAQLLKSAATVTTLGHKQMDADSQARDLLDRMAVDVMQMVKRSDVNYHLKIDPAPATNTTDCQQSPVLECGTQRPGNDEMAFYSNVPGYYASGSTGSQQGPVSLVGYRINSSATTLGNKMERLGAGLIWNGVSTINVPNQPVLFLTALDPWSTAKYASTSTLDIVGPNVFRFEYYYLLKNGNLSSTPWYTGSTVSGMQGVAAIVTDIAIVDPKSRGLLNNAQVTTLQGTLSDYNGQAPGVLLSNWRSAIDTNPTNASLPRAALSAIRLYERFLYLSPPTLQTP
jgi:Tfp pilus assembly protein PilV